MFCPICGSPTEHLDGSIWGVSRHQCGPCEITWVLTNEAGVPYTVQDKTGEEQRVY